MAKKLEPGQTHEDRKAQKLVERLKKKQEAKDKINRQDPDPGDSKPKPVKTERHGARSSAPFSPPAL